MPIAVRPNATAASGSSTSMAAVEGLSTSVHVANRPRSQTLNVVPEDSETVGSATVPSAPAAPDPRAPTPARHYTVGMASAMKTSTLTIARANSI
jgi:hypothetical protein